MATVAERLDSLRQALHIDQVRERLETTRQATAQPDLWSDRERALQLTQQQARDEELLKQYDDLRNLAAGSEETELLELAGEELARLEQQALLSGEHDERGAILSLHAGAGGTDAQDWTEMLWRMYQRFVERGKEGGEDQIVPRQSWKIELLDLSAGEEAGLKSLTCRVSGLYAYGLLKAEAGVHRLVRLSPFNSAKLRQTSFALVDVTPQVTASDHIELDEKELRIDVYRSSGKGGQGVNTTDSAVRITHIPTGIAVAIQNERSQLQNKATALEILKSRLLAKRRQEEAASLAAVRGEVPANEWGSQIRSYVLHPYKMVKDHRTGVETSDVEAVLDGQLDRFMSAYLQWQATK